MTPSVGSRPPGGVLAQATAQIGSLTRALATAYEPANGDAAAAARGLLAGPDGLLARLDAARLPRCDLDFVLPAVGRWYDVLRRRPTTRVWGGLALRELVGDNGTVRLPSRPRRLGFREHDLASLALDAYSEHGEDPERRALARTLVAGLAAAASGPQECNAFFVALELLRPRVRSRLFDLDDRRAARAVSFALTHVGRRAALGPLIDRLLGPADPWLELDVPIRARVEIADEAAESEANGATTGRIRSLRRHGAVLFAEIGTDAERSQLSFDRRRHPGVTTLRRGDLVAVRGTVGRDREGSAVLRVAEFVSHRPCVLDVARRPLRLPSARLIRLQAGVIATCRQQLANAGFAELVSAVATPGFFGGRSRPFVTRTADGTDLYLRVTAEVALKAALAAGVPRCYELGPMFRNEGLDRDHLPEFWILEAVAAGMPLDEMLEFVVGVLAAISRLAGGPVSIADTSARTAVLAATGLDIDRPEDLDAAAELVGAERPGTSIARAAVVDKLVKAKIVPAAEGIVALRDLPTEQRPLIASGEEGTGRVWVLLNGVLVAEVAREETSYERVAAALEGQLCEDRYPVSRDYRGFLELLAAGIPPCTGVGLGISRVLQAILPDRDIRRTRVTEWYTSS